MSEGVVRAGPSSRKSYCEVLVFVGKTPNEQTYFLLVSSASRNSDAVLIRIVPTTGELEFSNTPGVDVFPNLEAAKTYLSSQGRLSVKKSGCSLLGYAIVACNAWVLLATEIQPTAYLPGVAGAPGHYVHTIVESSWQVIPLQIRTSYPEQDLKRGEMLNEFAVAGYHYFCESFDITRPYPSTRPPTDPSWEFVWNYYLTQPFRRVGLHDVAPHMLQGMAEMKAMPDIAQTPFTVRDTRLEGLTMWRARQTRSSASRSFLCRSKTLLSTARSQTSLSRASSGAATSGGGGSVPLRWSQSVKSNAVSTAIAIEPERTFSGSRKYFRRLQLRYHKLSLPSSERVAPELTLEQRKDSLRYPVAVVNLLRKGSMDRDRSEARLYSAFCDLLTTLNKQSGMNVINIGFDWHELAGTHAGLQPVIEMLWAASEAHFRGFGYTQGHLRPRSDEAPAPADFAEFPSGMVAVFEQRQRGIFRFNCADSLDRTNVASFYSSLQVLLEQGRGLKLRLVRHVSAADVFAPMGVGTDAVQARAAGSIKKGLASIARGAYAAFGNASTDLVPKVPSGSNLAAAAPVYRPPFTSAKPNGNLPPGWEQRNWTEDDGSTRTIYINHVDKSSSWTPPEWPPYEMWELVAQSITDMRRTIHRPLLLEYKTLFLVSGDRNAELYTGSPAMHSAQLDLLLGTGEASHGITGFINNANTAIRRRINNIVTDERTHSIFEMVLGLPAKASAGLSTETFNQGISYELSAEAQRLPVADDYDSDDDDAISRMPWPALSVPISPSAAPVSPPNDGPQSEPGHHRAASAPPVAHVASPNLAAVEPALGVELLEPFAPAYATHMHSSQALRSLGPSELEAVLASAGTSCSEPTASAHPSVSAPDLMTFSPKVEDAGAAVSADPFAAVAEPQAAQDDIANAGSQHVHPIEDLLVMGDPLLDPLGALQGDLQGKLTVADQAVPDLI